MSIAPPKAPQVKTASSETQAYSSEATLRHGLGNPYDLDEWQEAIKRTAASGAYNWNDAAFAFTDNSLDVTQAESYHAEIQLPDHMVSSREIIQKLRKIQEANKKRSEKSTHRRHEEEKTFESFTAGPGR
tara:strand:+ start:614 stop:1003 length:390 start_codon:yes stop_codon:yes gene_type:complete